MNKRDKAFTLIELLAVIIILAIVALIATPIILDVVEDARISAGRSEANMILSGINNYCASSEMKKQMGTLGENDVDCSNKTSFSEAEIKKMINLGDAKIIKIRYGNGKITELIIESNNYEYELQSNGQFTVSKINDDSSEPETPDMLNFTIDGVVYQSLEGMTWEQWVNSDYSKNNNGEKKFVIYDDVVCFQSINLPIINSETSQYIKGHDVIQKDGNYKIIAGGSN